MVISVLHNVLIFGVMGLEQRKLVACIDVLSMERSFKVCDIFMVYNFLTTVKRVMVNMILITMLVAPK